MSSVAGGSSISKLSLYQSGRGLYQDIGGDMVDYGETQVGEKAAAEHGSETDYTPYGSKIMEANLQLFF